MRRPSVRAKAFLKAYGAREAELERAAAAARDLVSELTSGVGLDIEPISSRAKSAISAIRKVISKEYGLPSVRMTDIIGVRVICFYGEDVDKVVGLLKSKLVVNERKTIDKRGSLGLRQFGYRSVHLIVRSDPLIAKRYPDLGDRWFEIQVRSLLEHSWAEIEHQVVYKADVAFPEQTVRRFSALAATLEMVDLAFVGLRAEERELIQAHTVAYAGGLDLDADLDAARLAGLMQADHPKRPGWSNGFPPDTAPPRFGARLAQALALNGITTAGDLRSRIAQTAIQQAINDYAIAYGIAPDQVSHTAVLLIVVGAADLDVLDECFPQEALDPPLQSALAPGS